MVAVLEQMTCSKVLNKRLGMCLVDVGLDAHVAREGFQASMLYWGRGRRLDLRYPAQLYEQVRSLVISFDLRQYTLICGGVLYLLAMYCLSAAFVLLLAIRCPDPRH